MNLTIHRGSHKIGGSCVEMRTGKTRILIDFGMPLVDEKREPFDSKSLRDKSLAQLKEEKILPDIQGLYRGEPRGIDAILISHSHQDHYGLLDYANPEIPLYMTRGVKAMIEVSNIFIHHKSGKIDAQVVRSWRPFTIGDFTVTPYLMDHSGPDALAFLVEAEGKRVFYSGDFRAHGRKRILFETILKNPPKDIDCLLLEGTMIGREEQRYADENAIENRMAEILTETKNIVFLSCSSQNIDRIVSAYKACLRAHRTFVIDLYTAFILSKLLKISKNLPQYKSNNVCVMYWKHHADNLVNAGYRGLLFAYKKGKIELPEIVKKRDTILMIARANPDFSRTLKDLGDVKGAKLVYSMYDKYLTDGFKAKCEKKGIEIEHVHTSGHATVEDLKAFAAALNPKMTIPIHTFYADHYEKLFRNVKVLDDGEVLSI